MNKEQPHLVEANKLGLITIPPSSIEEAQLKLDTAIDRCCTCIKQMRESIKFLSGILEHPFHVEALDNMNGIIDEALIPYLAEMDKEFREIAPL